MKFLYILIAILTLNFMSSCRDGRNGRDGDNEKISDFPQINSPQIEFAASRTDSEGYIMLFDGKSLKGWRGYNDNKIPSNWNIENGILKLASHPSYKNQTNGDLIFTRKFRNFELSLDWMVAEGSVSGVLYLVNEISGLPINAVSPKCQIIDDVNHPEAKNDKEGKHRSCALYEMMAPRLANTRPCGSWNTTKIRVYNGNVEHYQNGALMLRYTLWTPQWEEMLASSRFNQNNWPEAHEQLKNCGGPTHEGYIGLQDLGCEVWFRNIKIKVLDPVAQNL